MIGIDTNVLVRYLVQDEPQQAARVTRLLESLSAEEPAFVSVVVLAETVWVLESCYAADIDQIEKVVETLLRTDAVHVAAVDVVWRALRRFKADRGDFADTLIAELAKAAGCRTVYTFDRAAAKRAGMTPLR
ncbi:MAG TPA: type II toxin-antitoxin system VapC family toxin [Nevskiaceae bacterium]|nr:type II toxin-antitoxin system VapC family toxin [Nevskiaceae bacterium]